MLCGAPQLSDACMCVIVRLACAWSQCRRRCRWWGCGGSPLPAGRRRRSGRTPSLHDSQRLQVLSSRGTMDSPPPLTLAQQPPPLLPLGRAPRLQLEIAANVFQPSVQQLDGCRPCTCARVIWTSMLGCFETACCRGLQESSIFAAPHHLGGAGTCSPGESLPPVDRGACSLAAVTTEKGAAIVTAPPATTRNTPEVTRGLKG